MTTFAQYLASQYEVSRRDEKNRIANILQARYSMPTYRVYNWVDEAGDPDVEYIGFDLVLAQDALNEAVRIEGFETITQTWLLASTLNEDSDEVIVDSKDIAPINEETDSIMYDVRSHFGGKYTSHLISDNDSIQLRIADHSGNCYNCTGRCISIVIADLNATERFLHSSKQMTNEYFFGSEYTADEIIEEVTAMLLEEGVMSEAA